MVQYTFVSNVESESGILSCNLQETKTFRGHHEEMMKPIQNRTLGATFKNLK